MSMPKRLFDTRRCFLDSESQRRGDSLLKVVRQTNQAGPGMRAQDWGEIGHKDLGGTQPLNGHGLQFGHPIAGVGLHYSQV